MKKINLHLYPSTFKFESRILKETWSISESGLFDQILIVALWEKGLDEHQSIDDKRKIWRVKLRSGITGSYGIFKILKFIEWMSVVFLRMHKDIVILINCHSLSILPIGVIFKVLFGTILVYDTHELETETCESKGRRRRFAKIVERFCLRFVDHTIVVSESIATWYRCNYNELPCTVVRNIPIKLSRGFGNNTRLKERLGISSESILFIYQGVIDQHRGVEILLDVFSQLNQDKHIVFMGYGGYVEKVKTYSNRYVNIHFHPAVKPDQLASFTKEADVGISLIENACLSYYYCLPNKVFEYMHGGLPIIASDFPDMGALIRDCQCGWTVKVTRDSVLNLIRELDKKEIERKKKYAINSWRQFDWRSEASKMLHIYEKLIGDSPKKGLLR